MVAPITSQGRVLIQNCRVAREFFVRFMGLMLRKGIGEDEAILFPKCNSIHTMFMRFPIDVVLLDEVGTVVRVHEGLKPWRLLMPNRFTKHIVELKARRARDLGIVPGMVLKVDGVWR